MNRGKRAAAKDNEVAEVTVDMSSLKSGSVSEDWYHLAGVTPIGEWGSLRLNIRYLVPIL
jgi:Ras GTPase-activating protein 1